MSSAILSAISSGYPSRVILDYLVKKYPKHAGKIRTAEAAGYTSDQILRKISGDKDNSDDEKYLTEHERTQKNDASNKKKAYLQAIGALGTAGAVAAGAYGLATSGRSIRPNEVLPPERNRSQQGIGTQQRKGIGYNQPTRPREQREPSPRFPSGQGPISPPAPRNPEKNIDLIRNMREDTRVENILKGVPDIATAIQVLKKVIPRSKVALLEKAEGGFEQAIQDYAEHIQNNPPAIKERSQPPQKQPKQEVPQLLEEQGKIPQMQAQEQEFPKEELRPIQERTLEAALGATKQEIPETKPELKKENFNIPNYRYAGEPHEEFKNREILFSAVNKAAKAISEGKSFLDYPFNKEAQYSTASDVLRFIGGIPNVYNALLDDEEKQELSQGLLGSFGPEKGSIKGEGNIYGAQLTPNLIWNLLLSVEPKLSKIEKPSSVKGYKMSPGKKMGSSEIRRFLNHAVYGVLSGKTVSTDLADKIEKISSASAHLDIIAKAAKDGNLRKMDMEMQKLMDDAYFSEVMDIKLEEMLMTHEQIENSERLAKEDTKNAASIKAKATRDKKKRGVD